MNFINTRHPFAIFCYFHSHTGNIEAHAPLPSIPIAETVPVAKETAAASELVVCRWPMHRLWCQRSQVQVLSLSSQGSQMQLLPLQGSLRISLHEESQRHWYNHHWFLHRFQDPLHSSASANHRQIQKAP